ncbi:cleft lip and palate transmembrane protein 1-like protein [Copidosoma floridanum]|uniref:cleft lip and palate transmembrane protein 1-like protein n=1 Tax=Copidosoma floridanum TaxID=29053 RepID=UPI0006C96640|nr:cleft lip and palate transmembrane protein 1-like protein [Copidosoma floridanum]
MFFPSFTILLSGLFLGYIAHSFYTISHMFSVPTCTNRKNCIKSHLNKRPKIQLNLFTSTMINPLNSEAQKVYTDMDFDYTREKDFFLLLDIPYKTRQNGTLFLHILLSPSLVNQGNTFHELKRNSNTVFAVVKLTKYAIPEAETFNLVGKEESSKSSKKREIVANQPISHLKSKITFTIMTDDIELPLNHIPLELLRILKTTPDKTFLPLLTGNFLHTKNKDLIKILPTSHNLNMTITYNPISYGKLRLILHLEAAMMDLKKIGFTDKDTDEVKSIFADTNLYLLAGTIVVSGMHLLFDFLAFKSDILFWRNKNDLTGLSMQTVLWRAFSQAVIFLYLVEEGSSLLVLVPAGIGAIIEFWKTKKFLKAEIFWNKRVIPRIKFNCSKLTFAEKRTREIDAESMKYFSYLIYPLIIVGAVYTLLYLPHKSWYSWFIQSIVHGVYAFGFLFMLPQLFVNYKLKSVAHLPWRSFMYKAFNTFIDDVFAFIITMPIAHRVACFRDDAVFMMYLYQRWLYPVDNSRIDSLTMEEDPVKIDTTVSLKKEK